MLSAIYCLYYVLHTHYLGLFSFLVIKLRASMHIEASVIPNTFASNHMEHTHAHTYTRPYKPGTESIEIDILALFISISGLPSLPLFECLMVVNGRLAEACEAIKY